MSDDLFMCDGCGVEHEGKPWDVDGATLCDECHAARCTEGENCEHGARDDE